MKEDIRSFKYNNEEIQYIVIKKKIKNVYIVIEKDNVYVKVPIRTSDKYIQTLIKQKQEWIYNKLQNELKKEDRQINLLEKNYIFLLGRKVEIRYINWNLGKIEIDITKTSCSIYLPYNFNKVNNISRLEKLLDNKLKDIAIAYITNAINKYSKMTGLVPNKVMVRKFKKIWGNCSSNGDIKLNQNLIWYDVPQIEYVCLHELTHLKYMNHQKEFWSFIEKYMPDYKIRANKLKE